MVFIPHSKPDISAKDIEAVVDILKTGMIASGAKANDFAREAGLFCGYEARAVSVASGTTALYILLRALGVGNGDEVIVPTYVCSSVRSAVCATGATCVLCDVSGPWVMTASDVDAVKTSRTRAAVLVHTFGIDASSEEFASLGFPVIDDLCQAFGLQLRHRSKVGAFCSFHATKCLTAGEGGVVISCDNEISKRLYGFVKDRAATPPMSDLQAALGLSQLDRYSEMLATRRRIANEYLAQLPESLTAPLRRLAVKSVYFRFPVRVASFDRFQKALARKGISVRRGVDHLLHWDDSLEDGRFPGAAKLFASTASLPMYPALTPGEVERVISAVREAENR